MVSTPSKTENIALIVLVSAQRSCAITLEIFTQSFLHRAKSKTRGPVRGSGSALIVVAHVFNWSPVHMRFSSSDSKVNPKLPLHYFFKQYCHTHAHAKLHNEFGTTIVFGSTPYVNNFERLQKTLL